MECIRGLYNVRPRHRGAVMTIGNFDGLHAGHRHLIGLIRARAQALHAPSLVMLFEPQPREFFQGAQAPARLMDLGQKLAALRQTGVDYVLALRFNEALARLSATDFIDHILTETLAVRGIVVGDDFRFGAGRAGDFALLQAAGKRQGFAVETASTFLLDGQRVSSTRLRAALAAGDLEAAKRLLGRPYAHCGRVVHGDARGRQIGFPTANLTLPEPAPLRGVFAVSVMIDGKSHPAIANVGRRPTFGAGRTLLEAHLLDFAGNLYGRTVAVIFLKKLRDELAFASVDALVAQIHRDRDAARAFFADHKGTS
ncbi:MAG: bifunctional riboflavin kinase/FAD synthetase [Gammaproteobacteria bacterium]|nr:bifunctional riboflavin kinase/FAD synthetase [Gammaproteobacteria bacterium]